ncbi:stabilin-2-like [Dreissena polymorpha]|uniref:stabilin-2-like n=1 Tax=Dreissena polymorpha TaxID=45954 RepID=UPI0022650975|nr:stabilin-2-like [Dreissena polymorpha]
MCDWPYVENDNSTGDDNGTSCEKLDTCTVPPFCHKNAACQMMNVSGPDSLWKTCSCIVGYHGDGFACDPDDPCQVDNRGCDLNTTDCVNTSPGQSKCVCKSGYHEYVLTVGCSLIDMCALNKTACHPKATCTTPGPHQLKCSCPVNYVGDGRVCFGNLLQTIIDLDNSDPDFKGQLSLVHGAMEKYYKKELTEHGPFTMFIANNEGFRAINTGDYQKWLSDEVVVRRILREHMIAGELTMDKLNNMTQFHTLQGSTAELLVSNRDTIRYRLQGSNKKGKVERGDIQASNGIIHVINRLLVTPSDESEYGFKGLTIADNVKQIGKYNRLESLIMTAGDEIVSLLGSDNVTLFAPINSAWDALPVGSREYLTSAEGKSNLLAILKDHIYDGVLEVTDIVNMRLLMSKAGSVSYVYVSPTGELKVNNHATLLQADIVASNGLIHDISEVKIPNGASTLPNYCDVKSYGLVRGTCRDCREDMKCYGEDVLTDQLEQCQYLARNADGKYEYYPGCAVMCNRTYATKHCCDGFYGLDCLPCPGGHKNPCNGRGKCSDGYWSDGSCTCDKNFGGPACDKCFDDRHFGPNCTQECTCIHGRDNQCNSGPSGNGRCVSCMDGYQGSDCEIQSFVCGNSYSNNCHAHALCIWIEEHLDFRCICKPGYSGSGSQCDAINICELGTMAGCHLQATCTMTGPGTANCTCNKGWSGDGKDCQKETTCSNHLHCHKFASCDLNPASNQSQNQYICRCKPGFYGNGTYCEYKDQCDIKNGGCDPRALCKHVDRSRPVVNCTCPIEKGLSGSGFSCYGNLLVELGNMNDTKLLYKFLMESPVVDQKALLQDNYTLFVINDTGFQSFLNGLKLDAYDKQPTWWRSKANMLTLINYHTIQGTHRLEELILRSKIAKIDTMADGYSLYLTHGEDGVVKVMPKKTGTVASVTRSNIIATNGYINIIDKVLEPYVPMDPVDYPSLSVFLEKNPQYSMFADWLKEYNLIATIENLDSYTLFIPTNEAAGNLNRTVTRDFLTAFIHTEIKLMLDYGEGDVLITSFDGKTHRLEFSEKRLDLYVNGLRITRMDMFTYAGLVNEIDGLFHPIFNNCDNKIVDTQLGLCTACMGPVYQCQSGYRPPVNQGPLQTLPCLYKELRDGGSRPNLEELQGCQGVCVKEYVEKGCCQGYYGNQCLDCPGGPETPCQGHGVCSDGSRGNGTCQCEAKFIGTDCSSCIEGWAGKNCDIDKSSCEYKNGGCDMNAVCSRGQDGVISCVCDAGFEGDGYICSGPCERGNGGCHNNASCSYYVSSGISCSCLNGMVGDGKKYCNGDLLPTLRNLKGATVFYQSLQSLSDGSLTTALLTPRNLTVERNWTLFIPNDAGLKGQQLNEKSLMEHIVLAPKKVLLNSVDFGNKTVTTLANSSVVISYSPLTHTFYVNNSKVLEGNIPFVDGVVHLISDPLTLTSIEPRPQSAHGISSGAVIGIVVSVFVISTLAVVVVIAYNRSREGYWKVLQEWLERRKDSDSQDNSPLHVGDVDEGNQIGCPFTGNTDFGNPLFEEIPED